MEQPINQHVWNSLNILFCGRHYTMNHEKIYTNDHNSRFSMVGLQLFCPLVSRSTQAPVGDLNDVIAIIIKFSTFKRLSFTQEDRHMWEEHQGETSIQVAQISLLPNYVPHVSQEFFGRWDGAACELWGAPSSTSFKLDWCVRFLLFLFF